MPFAFLLLAMTAFFLHPAIGAEESDYPNTWRYPRIGVPLVESAPVVDGVVDETEWADATLLPPLFSRNVLAGDGAPPADPGEQTRVWIAYTEEAIYIAFRQGLPPGQRPPGERNEVCVTFGPFQFFAYAGSEHRQRRLDRADLGMRWQPEMEFADRVTEDAWEGEWRIPFKEIDMDGAPAADTALPFYVFSQWRGGGEHALFCWPYVQWRRPGDSELIFAGTAPGLRFGNDGRLTLSGGPEAPAPEVEAVLMRRDKDAMFYYPAIESALDISDVGGGTFRPFDAIIREGLEGFEPVDAVEQPGEYLLRHRVTFGGNVLSEGVEALVKNAPLEITAKPYYLRGGVIEIEAAAENEAAQSVRITMDAIDETRTLPLERKRAVAQFPTENLPAGAFEVTAESLDADVTVLDRAELSLERPELPDWWTLDEGWEPLVPEPWTPVEVSGDAVGVWGRTLTFAGDSVLPSSIINQGDEVLAGPVRLKTVPELRGGAVRIERESDEAAVVTVVGDGESMVLRQSNRIEFDGFMLVDLELSGEGSFELLEMEIPIAKDEVLFATNGWVLPGVPGDDSDAPNGEVPEEGFAVPPMIVTWVGNDRRGLELNMESVKGWSMREPGKAVELTPQNGGFVLRVRFIDKPVTLQPDEPRSIRFALIPTPTRRISSHVENLRAEIDFSGRISNLIEWTGYHAWHPPVHDAAKIEELKEAVAEGAIDRAPALFNGGWHVSMDDEENRPWVTEMFASPLRNRSFGKNKQYSGCYNSPFAEFLVNSFAHNARKTGINGIRFDTVTPHTHFCDSEIHGCGWRDDGGTLTGSHSIFSQREIWKRLYRAFHGGVVSDGIIFTPTGGSRPAVTSVQSFTDYREVSEGFFAHAENLKEGYPPDYVRAYMTGKPHGWRAVNSLKFGPLFFNERLAALLVHDAEPRFFPYVWCDGIEAHAIPVYSVYEAWEWVNRPQARFLGWWENRDIVGIDGEHGDTILSGVHIGPSERVLLTVSNYGKEPVENLAVRLNLAEAGLPSEVFAEDAITGEPLEIDSSGALRLDLYGQRYRMVKISPEKPRHADQGPNVLSDAPALLEADWSSPELALEPDAFYAIKCEIKIDEPFGLESENPNRSDRFNAVIRNFVEVGVRGEDVTDIPRMDDRYYPGGDEKVNARRIWEKTPGWTSVFVPFQTGDSPRAAVSIRGVGQGAFQMRNIGLVKIDAND